MSRFKDIAGKGNMAIKIDLQNEENQVLPHYVPLLTVKCNHLELIDLSCKNLFCNQSIKHICHFVLKRILCT